jgi:hypothetical protein
MRRNTMPTSARSIIPRTPGTRSRDLRGMLRNAVTLGRRVGRRRGALVTALSLIDPGPGVESLVERLGQAIVSGIAWGVRLGVAGAVIGTVFSRPIRLGNRGRRVADIHPFRFAIPGAVLGVWECPSTCKR